MGVDFCDLTELIRSLQRLEGNRDCFGTAEHDCKRFDCSWREYCLKPDGGLGVSKEEDSEKNLIERKAEAADGKTGKHTP